MVEISIILPCRDEEKAIGKCISDLKKVIKKENLDAEIIVSDSSTDSSPEIVKKEGAILLKHDLSGYGNAYMEGVKIAKGKYLFFADADGTYPLEDLPKFISELKKGNDFVIGNRFSGNIEKKAMPFFNRYIGNPILSGMTRIFFKTKLKDIHCGMRAIRKESYDKLELRTTGMEYATEMVVNAIRNKLKFSQIDIKYKQRIGKSKLSPFKDAWRHIRFMLLYSPFYLFMLPGILFFSIGLFGFILTYFQELNLFDKTLVIHPLFVFSILTILGLQILIFGLFAKTYAVVHLNDINDYLKKFYKIFNLEFSIFLGLLGILISVFILLKIFFEWKNSNYGELNRIREAVLALTILSISFQGIFSGFMLSIIGIKEK